MSKDRNLHFRCTEKEYEMIKAKAEKSNVTMSRFLIDSALKIDELPDIKLITSEIENMNLQISRIGNNINQVAHVVNTYDVARKKDLDAIRNEMDFLVAEYDKFLRSVSKLL